MADAELCRDAELGAVVAFWGVADAELGRDADAESGRDAETVAVWRLSSI